MRPVGFMMRRYRNYEKIFNGNKAELASAPQSALAPQCLCGFSRLVLQDFRPVRGLIQDTFDTISNKFFNLQDFRPVRGLILYRRMQFYVKDKQLARLSPRQGTDT